MRKIKQAPATVLDVQSDCDAPSAPGLLADLRAKVAEASRNRPLRLDLTEGLPTAIALQLIVSAAASLGRAQAFAGYGPAAAAALCLEQAQGDSDAEDRPIR
jgi:hypothetical protein